MSKITVFYWNKVYVIWALQLLKRVQMFLYYMSGIHFYFIYQISHGLKTSYKTHKDTFRLNAKNPTEFATRTSRDNFISVHLYLRRYFPFLLSYLVPEFCKTSLLNLMRFPSYGMALFTLYFDTRLLFQLGLLIK